jgi:cell wall-associated NlpC family hydrolase
MNRLLISSLIMLGLFGLRSVVLSLAPPAEVPLSAPPALPRSAGTDEVLAYARSLAGSPYRGGGCTPAGFDCSGFVQHVFAEAGYDLPRSSRGMARACEPVELAAAVPGDLLFFAGRDGNKSRIGHVALLLERQGEAISMIHATDRGVVIDQFSDMPYYQQRLISAGKPPL